MHHFSYAVERARTVLYRSRRRETGLDGGYRRAKRPSWGGFIPPIGDPDMLTIVLLSVIAILSVLDLMLFCPDLGSVVAQYNQF